MGNDLSLTGYLFSKPSYIDGVGRILDIGGLFDDYNEDLTAEKADYRAVFHDWKMIGISIEEAAEKYVQKAEET